MLRLTMNIIAKSGVQVSFSRSIKRSEFNWRDKVEESLPYHTSHVYTDNLSSLNYSELK